MQVAAQAASLLLAGGDQALAGALELAVGAHGLDERADLGADVLQEPSVARAERVVAHVDLDPQPAQRRHRRPRGRPWRACRTEAPMAAAIGSDDGVANTSTAA